MKTQNTEELEITSLLDKFVYMDKTIEILEAGLKTQMNVILYGPGGHGKSEVSTEFFFEKGINPFIMTMGTGVTTDRLFGGINIPVLNDLGKIEYLVENSFMNHEFVIFEELFDAPDYILEQLKDILSSGFFRNGSQVFPIKTRFIICCTNKTRAEFSKNSSLKALMERFPLEHNVVWDNYTELNYNKLLETRFGEGLVDPIIPYILEQYSKNGITISPRVAINAYTLYEECGPDTLNYLADFSAKKTIINDALGKYKDNLELKKLTNDIQAKFDEIKELTVTASTYQEVKILVDEYILMKTTFLNKKINDEMISYHSTFKKVLDNHSSSVNGKVSMIDSHINRVAEKKQAEIVEAQRNTAKVEVQETSETKVDDGSIPQEAIIKKPRRRKAATNDVF